MREDAERNGRGLIEWVLMGVVTRSESGDAELAELADGENEGARAL